MVFPMKQGATAHPSMVPRRPERPSEAHRLPPRIHSERPVWPGVVQQISTTSDRLHVRKIRDGKNIFSSFRFELKDIEILERAIELSKAPEGTPVKNVGTIALKIGGCIEVGAVPGVCLLRIVVRTRVTDRARIEGVEEITALEQAIAHFRVTAARAAF